MTALPRFDAQKNWVLRASAGTGKTEALTLAYLELVSGVSNQGQRVSPSRIVALTFTEKAALEMRERIGTALRWLRGERLSEKEPISVTRIRELLREDGQGENIQEFSEAYDELSTARIGTIHSFCASMLRIAALEAGIDPAFQVIDERTGAQLLEDSISETLVSLLQEHSPSVVSLVHDFGGFTRGTDKGLIFALRNVLSRIWEHGGTLPPLSRVEHNANLRLNNARERLHMRNETDFQSASHQLIASYERWIQQSNARREKKEKFEHLLAKLKPSLQSRSHQVDFLVDAAVRLKTLRGKTQATDLDEVDTAVQTLWIEPACLQRLEVIYSILETATRQYQAKKAKMGGLDLTDLIVVARDVARDHPNIRRQLARDIDAVFVDEFQDTNGIQRDLVYLLRANATVESSVPLASQLVRGGLFVVGDRKQSIYGFRGADVAVFEEVAKDILSTGGEELSLRASYRSVRSLVDGVNELTIASLRSPAANLSFIEDVETLEPVHDSAPDACPSIEWIPLEEKKGVRDEAQAIARRILAMTEKATCVQVRDQKTWRSASLRDIAILLPRFTHVTSYAQALEHFGIPYFVVKGRGLLQTVEARDVLSLAQCLFGVDDGRATLSVLRSPMIASSDSFLAWLSEQSNSKLSTLFAQPNVEWLYGLDCPSFVSVEERERIVCGLKAIKEARSHIHQLGLARTVRRFLSDTAYEAVLAGLPGAHQRIANVRRIFSEITQREESGEDGRAIVADLLKRQKTEEEPEADIVSETSDAVRIMTVHQSKGLQFPIVFAGDLGREMRTQITRLEYVPLLGIGVGVRSLSGSWLYGETWKQIKASLKEKDDAERLRLFYVQITRAQDRLVLVGKRSGFNKKILEPTLEDLSARSLIWKNPPLADETLAEASSQPTQTVAPESLSQIHVHAAPPVVRVQQLEMSATELENFYLCPRRFRAKHILRLPELWSRTHDVSASASSGELEIEVDPNRTSVGTHLHRILEEVDWSLAIRDPDAAIANACTSIGIDVPAEAAQRLRAFFLGPYVQRLSILPDKAIHREHPFSLAFRDKERDIILHGQIDLVVETEDFFDIIDYKTTHPKGLNPTEAYRFQLSLYAHVLRQILGGDRPVRAGIQFLDGLSEAPVYLQSEFSIGPEIRALAAAIMKALHSNDFKGREPAHCRAIECGYFGVCHRDKTSVQLPLFRL